MTANWQEYLEDELEKIAALSNQVAEEKIALEEGENRMVAIFFLDIRGFTAMSEKLHSEQLKRIIDKVFIVFSNVITKFGGFVNQYEGDKIMAFFGSKVKTETDTERAIKSALEILEKRTQVNALFAKQNIELEVRIGINTGMVTTGKVGLKRERDFTVYGDAVNVASRLESNAPINQILITKRTMKLVEDKFDFLFHQKLNVKGKSEPLETYTVLQQKKQKIERWERKSLILKSEYVGRENEVSKMENLFIAASASDQEKEYRSWMIGLRGDAGIGKSRLTHEFTKKILQQANVDDAGKMMLFGYTNSYAQAPFFIWISLLKKYFDISETDDAETIKSKFEFGCLTLTRELSHTEHKNFYNIRKMLALLCGIHENSEEIWEPKQLQLSIQLAIRYFLEAAAKIANKRNLPLIIVLEDLHWLDEASLQMFKTLLQTLNSEEKHDGRPAKKIFFILTYRQDYNLFNDVLLHTIFEEISLQPLSQHNFFKMVSSMLGDISLPDELVEKLLYQSAGNPFYIEEWVHWLIEQERIIKQDNQWMIQQPENEIPESLHSLILSRIDSLSTKQKQILQTASVIGQLFHSSVLRHVNEKILSIDNLDEELSHLTESGWFIKQKEATAYAFRHIITCEVSYSTILQYNRIILHRLIAEYSENLFANNSEYYAFLANHFEQSEMVEKSIEYILKTANHAKDNYQNKESISLYEKLLTKYKSGLSKNQIIEIITKKAEILMHIGKWKEAKEIFETALQQARNDSNNNRMLEVLGFLGYQNYLFGNYLEARQCFYEKKSLAENLEEKKHLADAMGYIGLLDLKQCDYENAEKSFQQKILLCTELKDNHGIITVLGNLGILYAQTGKYDLAKECFEKKLEKAVQLNDKLESSVAYGYLGMISKSKGEYEKALMFFEKRLKVAEELGDKKGITASYANIGIIYHYFGDYDNALQYYQKLEIMEHELGEKYGLAAAFGYLGVLYKDLGNYEQAMQFYQKQLQLMEELDDKKGISVVLGNMGKVHAHHCDYNEALRCFERQLEIAKTIDFHDGTAIAIGNLSSIYVTLGQYEKSKEWILKKIEIAEKLGSKLLLCTGYGSLGEILKEQGKSKEAIPYLTKHLHIGWELFHKVEICKALGNLGDIHLLHNVPEKAKEHYQEQMELTKEMNDPFSKLSAWHKSGLYFLKTGDLKKALRCFIKQLKIAKSINEKQQIGMAYHNLGNTYLQAEKMEKALNYAKLFLQICQSAKNSFEEAMALFLIGKIAFAKQQYAEALPYFEKSIRIYDELTPQTVYHLFFTIESCLLMGDFQKARRYFQSIRQLDVTDFPKDSPFYLTITAFKIKFYANNSLDEKKNAFLELRNQIGFWNESWQKMILMFQLYKMSLILNDFAGSNNYLQTAVNESEKRRNNLTDLFVNQCIKEIQNAKLNCFNTE